MSIRIDTFETARTGSSRAGELAVAGLRRLGSMLASAEGRIEWRLRAWRETRPAGDQDFMELAFDATLQPACVRCLRPVPVGVSVVRRYRLVDTEDEAQRLDPDDDEYDVIAGARDFELDALIEDEAIMELPPAARHDRCAAAVPGRSDGDVQGSETANPFESLRRLRRNSGSEGGESGS